MKNNFFLAIVLSLTGLGSFAQDSIAVYPTNWWVDMKNPTLQLMVHGKDIGRTSVVTLHYPGVTVLDWHRVHNPNYLFVHLRIAGEKKPGTVSNKGGKALLKFFFLGGAKGKGAAFCKGRRLG